MRPAIGEEVPLKFLVMCNFFAASFFFIQALYVQENLQCTNDAILLFELINNELKNNNKPS